MITQINLRNQQFTIREINAKRSTRGQYTLEWGILVSAVVIAGVLMRGYVRGALRANVKSTEMQLNGAMQDNRP
ncbi:MAG: hypothetical protein Q8R78_02460 [Candidatus Omnitrophota bacterium]|nr:hypothetical protein [Candidatus Omnitrophota bacterium]